MHEPFLQVVAYAAAVYQCYGLSTQGAAIVVGLPDRAAQVFQLSRRDMLALWGAWRDRLRQFWALQADR